MTDNADQELPEGVINADPPGGWEGIDDIESRERNADSVGSPNLTDAPVDVGDVESPAPSRGADPDLGVEES